MQYWLRILPDGRADSGRVDVQPPLEANAQLAKACKPSMRSLHHPAMATQPLTALDASSANPAGNATLLQIGAATRVVVALVGMQLRWPATRLALQSPDGWQSIDAFLEHHRIVPVCTADQHHQRNAPRVYDDVPLGAEFASVRRVGARFLAPRGLGTDERRCSPGSNRSGRAYAGAPAWRGAVSATPRQRSSREAAANTACRCHSPGSAADLPRRCRCAARTGCY